MAALEAPGDAAADLVHGHGWNSAARWGGWSWREPRGAEHYRTCSFCGSISPEDLAAEPLWRASWADQKYGWPHKFYVQGVVNRHPEILRIMAAATPGQADRAQRETTYQWHAVGEIPDGTDVSGWRLDDSPYSHVGLGSDETHFVKFYTRHLADPALDPASRDVIEHRCGLRFRFSGEGGVGWEAYPPPNLPDCACHWAKTPDGIWSQGQAVPGCRWHSG